MQRICVFERFFHVRTERSIFKIFCAKFAAAGLQRFREAVYDREAPGGTLVEPHWRIVGYSKSMEKEVRPTTTGEVGPVSKSLLFSPLRWGIMLVFPFRKGREYPDCPRGLPSVAFARRRVDGEEK